LCATAKPSFKGAMPTLLLEAFNEPFPPKYNLHQVPQSTKGSGPII